MEDNLIKSPNPKKQRNLKGILAVLVVLLLVVTVVLTNRSKNNSNGEGISDTQETVSIGEISNTQETISSEEISDTQEAVSNEEISNIDEAGNAEDYIITTKNYFDYQNFLECSGYASAYVLRSLGVEVTGLEVYDDIPNKYDNGTVPILYLVEYLLSEGYEVNVFDGTLDDLKQELDKGTPVIAFVRTGPDEEYLHYLPIVGYGKDVVYAVDSLKYKVNAENEYYNRVIKNEDFLNMWDSGVYNKNTYITIALK